MEDLEPPMNVFKEAGAWYYRFLCSGLTGNWSKYGFERPNGLFYWI